MAKRKIEVAEWIETGEFAGDEKDASDIIDSACNLLNGASSTEILGPVLFKGKDGKYYTVVVEALVVEAHKDFVKDTINEKVEEAVQNGTIRPDPDQPGLWLFDGCDISYPTPRKAWLALKAQ